MATAEKTRASKDIQPYIKEKIAELRMKLLDLTNRNSLLNFRHSEKSLSHIRIIDELPDELFGSLLRSEQLTFKSLPEYDDDPQDEQIEPFLSCYREATLTDEEYLNAIEGLENSEESFEQLAKLERSLKNKVREQLGMPSLDNILPLSNAQWARKNGLEPKYDMPYPNEEILLQDDKHTDSYMQTLLRPKQLKRKLEGLRRYIVSDINETGVNTLYAAFGFLERYESDNSDKAFLAPLILLQLDPPTAHITDEGQIEYSIQQSEEEPQCNLPLREKLKGNPPIFNRGLE